MTSQDFDRMLASIRAEDPGAEVVAEAAARVRVRLREPGASIAPVPLTVRKPVLRWAIAAGLIIAAAVIVERTPARATVSLVDGKLYRVSAAMTELAAGSSIGENEEIRTGTGSRAVIRLRDGSLVELAERTDLAVSEGWRSKGIHLERGAVLVEAVRQRRGHFEVATLDCLVSVNDTILGVSRGTKGSRVSVVDGEAKVDRDGASQLLHRGDQAATSVTMANTSVAEEIAWSQNAAKYVALLGDLASMPGPGLRYGSKLASWLPVNTAIFASIPNLGPAMAEARGVFEENVKQNTPWNERQSRMLQVIIDRVRSFSDYLGDELVLAVPQVNGQLQDPILFAEVRRPGLAHFLDREMEGRPWGAIHDNVIALSPKPVKLHQGAFPGTPFGTQIAQRYQSGAGWLFAANLEQILPRNVQSAGGNARFLVMERKQNLGRPENLAALTFSGERTGIASWLASPGPMGSLDFVSPEASFSASFVVKSPGKLIRELLPVAGVPEFIEKFAETLGGEVTIAVDGLLLPTPGWKVALEVDEPARVQASIVNAGIKLKSEQIGRLTYYELSPGADAVVDYVFVDGYLLLAPNRALLTTAVRNRAAGVTLPRSAGFRSQLPQDGHMNFSALIYYNFGPAVGPIVDQLKATGLIPVEQQRAMSLLTANREPSLIYAYGEPDRIVAASRAGFSAPGLDTLVGLNAKGVGALRQLLPPVFERNHATRN